MLLIKGLEKGFKKSKLKSKISIYCTINFELFFAPIFNHFYTERSILSHSHTNNCGTDEKTWQKHEACYVWVILAIYIVETLFCLTDPVLFYFQVQYLGIFESTVHAKVLRDWVFYSNSFIVNQHKTAF